MAKPPIYKYWSGYFNVEVMKAQPNEWNLFWLAEAQKAKADGLELMVFKVPLKDREAVIEQLEKWLQSHD